METRRIGRCTSTTNDSRLPTTPTTTCFSVLVCLSRSLSCRDGLGYTTASPQVCLTASPLAFCPALMSVRVLVIRSLVLSLSWSLCSKMSFRWRFFAHTALTSLSVRTTEERQQIAHDADHELFSVLVCLGLSLAEMVSVSAVTHLHLPKSVIPPHLSLFVQH